MGSINSAREWTEFFSNFDKGFLKLFPDFIKRFNDFNKLEPDEELSLTTELRIFSLHRLGIQDANKIAEILGYSINPIYSYKNRIKNRSIVSGDEFCRKIMEIKTVEGFKARRHRFIGDIENDGLNQQKVLTYCAAEGEL